MPVSIALFGLLMLPFGNRALESSANDDAYDAAFVTEHGVKVDRASLLDWLRDRTPDEVKTQRIRLLIPQLGHARFTVRDAAAKDLLKIGEPALAFLEVARKDTDAEVASRAARLIEQIKAGPGTSLPLAILRLLRKHPSPDIVPVVMAYLPFANDNAVVDEAMITLVKTSIKDGKADPRLREYRSDEAVLRRAACGFILGRSTTAEDQNIARKLLADDTGMVRLRAAEGLLHGRHREGLPPLIALLDPTKDDLSWLAEDLLRRVSGDGGPLPPTDDKPENRTAYRKAWQDWLDKNGERIDLTKLTAEPAVLGLYLGIEYNTNLVWECGRDGQRRWSVQAEGPMDAQVLPGNRILIAEQTPKRVTERDMKGNILWEFGTAEETLNCRRLPNGNTWIGTRHSSIEVRPNKTVVFSYRFSEDYMHAVRRLPHGGAIGITSKGVIREIDAGGKTAHTITLTQEGTWGDVNRLRNGNYLVSNYGTGFVREIDRTGKTIRELKASDATSVEQLPNGQLLVSGGGSARITDWTGKTVWQASSNGCVRRIHTR